MPLSGIYTKRGYDFILLGALESKQCAVTLDTLHQECWLLCVPIAQHKTEDPAHASHS